MTDAPNKVLFRGPLSSISREAIWFFAAIRITQSPQQAPSAAGCSGPSYCSLWPGDSGEHEDCIRKPIERPIRVCTTTWPR